MNTTFLLLRLRLYSGNLFSSVFETVKENTLDSFKRAQKYERGVRGQYPLGILSYRHPININN